MLPQVLSSFMRCTLERPEERHLSSRMAAEAHRVEQEQAEVICLWISIYAAPERLWEWTATTAGLPSVLSL